MNNEMERSQQLDDFLDEQDWRDTVTVTDLNSVALPSGDDGGGLLAVQEPSSVRPMTYRIFNFLTLSAHRFMDVQRFLHSSFTATTEDHHYTSTAIHEDVAGRAAITRHAMNYIADILADIENAGFSDVERYWVRPHTRVLRMNYREFPAIEVGPLWPDRSPIYRAMGKPTRLIPVNERSADAMDW